MIMRDMDRALTMNPAMVNVRNIPHLVDRSVWTETLGAAGAVDYRRSGPPVATNGRPGHMHHIESKAEPFVEVGCEDVLVGSGAIGGVGNRANSNVLQ